MCPFRPEMRGMERPPAIRAGSRLYHPEPNFVTSQNSSRYFTNLFLLSCRLADFEFNRLLVAGDKVYASARLRARSSVGYDQQFRWRIAWRIEIRRARIVQGLSRQILAGARRKARLPRGVCSG